MKHKGSIHQCKVFWHAANLGENEGKHLVGTLARDANGHLYFAYDPDWVGHGIEISPMFLPLQIKTTPVSLTDPKSLGYEPNSAVRSEYRGLPGPFHDSLPDKWGMKLLAAHTGEDSDAMDALEILCHRGERCMGAFSYQPATSQGSPPHDLSRETLNLYCQRAGQLAAGAEPETLETAILDALEDSGGSAGGMRPKMLIAIRKADPATSIADQPATIPILRKLAGYDHHDMPPDFQPWLLKFDTEPDQCRGLIEQACAWMAREAGVTMPETTLIQTRSKKAGDKGTQHSHFAAIRFDRELVDGKWHRVHMHTAAAMLRRDFNQLDLDYTDLLELTKVLTGDPAQVRQNYIRAVFNVLVGNSDDHAKNHAFLLNHTGNWKISPAYDLTPSRLRLQPGLRSTSVLGNKNEKIPLGTLLTLADEHQIEGAMEIIQQVADATVRWGNLAEKLGIPKSIIERYATRINEMRPSEPSRTSTTKTSAGKQSGSQRAKPKDGSSKDSPKVEL